MTTGLLETLNNISRSLAILAIQVQAEALAGLGSRSKVAEYILLPVLRRIYRAPNLANTNEFAANFPGIDLYDPSSGLAVQVTSERSASKITETIETLAAGTLRISRLVVALITIDPTPRFRANTRATWQAATQGRFVFDPETDVLPFNRLLSRIQNLPPLEINEIATELQALVEGKHVVQLLPYLREQVEARLKEEQRIARYIPDVFVETQDAKYQARCFAHPALFVRRVAEWFDRQPFGGLNRLVAMSGVPSVSAPSTRALTAAETPEEAIAASTSFKMDLEPLQRRLTEYGEIVQETSGHLSSDIGRAYVLDETKYYIQMMAGGLQLRLRDRRTELHCVGARVFLLTGPAGQGKTNFLCDFTERFLLRHRVPCAYITVRQMSRISHVDLPEAVRQLVFPLAVTSLHDGLTTLAAACAAQRQPFVLVIDGLNEHPDIRNFAGQLEHLLETLARYPHVRVLMTCRTEFLEQRFGALLTGPLAPVLHVSKPLGQRFGDEQYRELVVRYFRFFRIRASRVAPYVIRFLQRDVLLLRFFCEAYGARDRDRTYDQPVVTGIYRDEIFQRYLNDKLGRVHQAVVQDRSSPHPLARTVQSRRVLSLVAVHMLTSRQFSNVPRSVVPRELDPELTALLDEELVLRHDLGQAPSLLAEPPEVLNFTFDEMRDYLLAQHLLSVHAQDPAEFARLVDLQQPDRAQSIEGIQRFLFYASRVPDNHVFRDTYRSHPWYSAVYDTEVFAVKPTYLDADDRQIVETALLAGGVRSQHFARELARRLSTSAYPILNLELLLDVVLHADGAFFTDVIVPAFGHRPYREGSLGDNLSSYIRDLLTPIFDPSQDPAFRSLLRLLLVLLPINASPTLDSSAMASFRQLISAHPKYALGLLVEALDEGRRWHRAFLWRLLSMATHAIDDPSPLIVSARAELTDSESDDLTRREAQWFLTRLAEAGYAS